MIFCIPVMIFFFVNASAQISRSQMVRSFNQVQREQKQWLNRQLPSEYYFNGKYTYELPRYVSGAHFSYTMHVNGRLLYWQPEGFLPQPYTALPSKAAQPFSKKKELSPLLKKLLYKGSEN